MPKTIIPKDLYLSDLEDLEYTKRTRQDFICRLLPTIDRYGFTYNHIVEAVKDFFMLSEGPSHPTVYRDLAYLRCKVPKS